MTSQKNDITRLFEFSSSVNNPTELPKRGALRAALAVAFQLLDRAAGWLHFSRLEGMQSMGVVAYRCPTADEEVVTAIETSHDTLVKMREMDLSNPR